MAEALTQRRPETAIAVGDMLGPYRLLSPIGGEGGMASVWLAGQTVTVLRHVWPTSLIPPNERLARARSRRELKLP